MLYDIVIVVTPALLDKMPDYIGLDFIVLATTYTESVANIVCQILRQMADDGSEVVVRIRPEPEIDKVGVFVDD